MTGYSWLFILFHFFFRQKFWHLRNWKSSGRKDKQTWNLWRTSTDEAFPVVIFFVFILILLGLFNISSLFTQIIFSGPWAWYVIFNCFCVFFKIKVYHLLPIPPFFSTSFENSNNWVLNITVYLRLYTHIL